MPEQYDVTLNADYENLPVDLTEAELKQKALQLAERLKQRKDVDARKKVRNTVFKEEAKSIDDEIDELRECVSTGKEKRLVAVFERQVPERRVIEAYRADTGHVIRTRGMTIDERQLALRNMDDDAEALMLQQRREAEQADREKKTDPSTPPVDGEFEGDGEVPDDEEPTDEDDEEDEVLEAATH